MILYNLSIIRSSLLFFFIKITIQEIRLSALFERIYRENDV